MAQQRVVLGLAIGTAYARAATAPVLIDDGDNAAADGSSSAGHARSSTYSSSSTPILSLSRPEIVVNADGARGTRTVVARRRPEEGAEGEEEWLVGEAARAAMAGRGGNVEAWEGRRILEALQGGSGRGKEGAGEEEEEGEEEEDDDQVEEVCGQLLAHVLEQAENFSGESPSDCVLAVPASFGEEERRAAIHACNMAGLSVLGVIREPMAAVLAYQQEQQEQRQSQGQQQDKGKKERVTVVFDLGYSHLDVAVVEEDERGLLRLLHDASTPAMGGEALVEKLVGLCLAEFRRKAGCDARESRRAMLKLRRECEAALRTLSTSQQADVEIDALYEGCDLRLRIPRARFEGECLDIFRGCLAAVDAAVGAAGLTKEDVDLLLLSGGAARVPKLQAWLQAAFPDKEQKGSNGNGNGGRVATVGVNPEEGAAVGAAIQAQLLAHASHALTTQSSSSDAHPVSAPVALSPLAFGLLVCPHKEGSGVLSSLVESFRRYATISSSSSGEEEDGGAGRKPFVLIGEGELLPAQRTVRVGPSLESGQPDLHVQLIAIEAGEAGGNGNQEAAVHSLGGMAVPLPAEGEGEKMEMELTMRMDADGTLDVVISSVADGKVLKAATLRPAAVGGGKQ